MVRLLSWIAILAFAALCFQNCTSSGFDSGSVTLNTESATPTSEYQSLTLTSAKLQTVVSTTDQVYVTGGTPPYKYAVTSGGGSITTNGVYTAPASTGTALVTVTDANSLQGSLLMTIVTSSTYNLPTAYFQVPLYRAYNAINGDHLYTLSLTEATYTTNYAYEEVPFYVYSNGGYNPIAIYRCLSSIGSNFLSQSSACEGSTFIGQVGYLEAIPINSATSGVYRCVNPTTHMHLETLNTAECTGNGYSVEGLIGYTAIVVTN